MDLLDSLLQVCLLLRSCLAIYLCNSSALAKICWRYRVHRPVYYHLMSWKSACLVFTSVRMLVGTASAFTQSNSLLLLKESSYTRSWKRGWFSWVILQKIPRFGILFLMTGWFSIRSESCPDSPCRLPVTSTNTRGSEGQEWGRAGLSFSSSLQLSWIKSNET